MNRRQFLRTSASLGIVGNATVGSAKAISSQDDQALWRTGGFDYRNTNRNPSAIGPNTNLEPVWEQKGPGHSAAQPLVTNKFIIAPSAGYITGKVGKDRLVFENDRLPIAHVYDAESGDLLNVAREPLHSDRNPVARQTNGMTLADGTLYAVAGEFFPSQNWDRGNLVFAIDPGTGDVKWWTQTTGVVDGIIAQNYPGSPIVFDDTLAVPNPCSGREPVDILDRGTGEILHRAKWHPEKGMGEPNNGEHSVTSPAALNTATDETNLLMGDGFSRLFAWNIEDRTFDWSFIEGEGTWSEDHLRNVYYRTNRHAVCVDEDTDHVLFVRALSVVAFDAENGKWEWTRTGNFEKVGAYVNRTEDTLDELGVEAVHFGGGILRARPVVTDDSIITMSSRDNTNYVLSLNKEEGTFNWVREFSGSASSLAASKHSLYVGVNNQLKVLNIHTGEDLSTRDMQGEVTDIVVAGGNVVTVTEGPDADFEQVSVLAGKTRDASPTTTTQTPTTQTTTTSTTQTSKYSFSTHEEQTTASTPGFGMATTLTAASLLGLQQYLSNQDSNE